MILDGHVARMGEERGVHRVWVWKAMGKISMGRPRRRWVGNIKMGSRRWDVDMWTALGWP